MLITELVILYSYRFLFRVDIVAHTTNNYVLIIQLMSAKILYFTIAYSLSKLSKQEGKIPVAVLKELLLYILPIASPSQILCKPLIWCRIEAPYWRF